MNCPADSRLPVLTLAAVTALFGGLVLASGCAKPNTTNPYLKTEQKDGPKADPWDTAARRLRKDTDTAAVRTTLAQLANDLPGRPDVPAPAPLSPEAEPALAAVVPLSEQDKEIIRPAGYGGLDPAYVAECLYLRDAARAVDPVGLPPADLTRTGFAWVCRQVYLHPWLEELQPGVFRATALPPTAVLRRGYGSGLERAYVFLGLLQQMGIDGCLIGPPEAAGQYAGYVARGPDGQPLTGAPKGPFWAVGARVGADILLFEPWRGEPFPGPDGKGIGTLAQVKTDPDQLKAWFADKNWGVTPDDVKKAEVFLAVPVTSLAPRIARLEQQTKAEVGARLAFDPAALRDRFTAAAPNGPGLPAGAVRFWNPPGDEFAYGRVLATFLPAEEGGTDRAEPGQRLSTRYRLSLVPQSVYRAQNIIPPELEVQGAVDRLTAAAANVYATTFLTPPTPRERIQRGEIQDAIRFLADAQDRFVRGLERLRSASPEQLATWAKAANEVFAALRQAQYPAGQLQSLPDTDPGVAAARAAVEEFWRSYAQTAQVVIDRASARVGLAEASYLLALAKHEQGERQQLRVGRASGADAERARAAAATAWAEAANAWRSYLDQSSTLPGFPGRAEHARALAERAEKLAGGK